MKKDIHILLLEDHSAISSSIEFYCEQAFSQLPEDHQFHLDHSFSLAGAKRYLGHTTYDFAFVDNEVFEETGDISPSELLEDFQTYKQFTRKCGYDGLIPLLQARKPKPIIVGISGDPLMKNHPGLDYTMQKPFSGPEFITQFQEMYAQKFQKSD
ncbi:MAG: hypothetical protein ACMXYA_02440 [Candidatus Woesearchaeota archaeon]